MFLLILTALVKIAFTAWTFGMMVRELRSETAIGAYLLLGSCWYLPSYDRNRRMLRPCGGVDRVRTSICYPARVLVLTSRSRQGLHRAYPHALIFSSCPPDISVRCISPGFYAIIGASAMLGGVTRMTSMSPTSRSCAEANELLH